MLRLASVSLPTLPPRSATLSHTASACLAGQGRSRCDGAPVTSSAVRTGPEAARDRCAGAIMQRLRRSPRAMQVAEKEAALAALQERTAAAAASQAKEERGWFSGLAGLVLPASSEAEQVRNGANLLLLFRFLFRCQSVALTTPSTAICSIRARVVCTASGRAGEHRAVLVVLPSCCFQMHLQARDVLLLSAVPMFPESQRPVKYACFLPVACARARCRMRVQCLALEGAQRRRLAICILELEHCNAGKGTAAELGGPRRHGGHAGS